MPKPIGTKLILLASLLLTPTQVVSDEISDLGNRINIILKDGDTAPPGYGYPDGVPVQVVSGRYNPSTDQVDWCNISILYSIYNDRNLVKSELYEIDLKEAVKNIGHSAHISDCYNLDSGTYCSISILGDEAAEVVKYSRAIINRYSDRRSSAYFDTTENRIAMIHLSGFRARTRAQEVDSILDRITNLCAETPSK